MTLPDPPRAPVLGLTGAVAAGKSTVSSLLRAAGCDVLDVDAMGHAALADPAVRDAVRQEFGDDVLGDDGELDRAALAAVAFADPETLARLEALVHPWVRERIRERLDAAPPDARAIVVDAALLFEGGLEGLCDATVCVVAPREERARRVREDRGWSDAELASREARQLPAEEKRTRADRVLENDAGRERLAERVAALLDELAPDSRAGTPGGRNGSG